MNEQPPNTFEEHSESIPTPEEIQDVFEQLTGAESYEEGRKIEDEKGLYLWEIFVSSEDGRAEYAYMRQGRYPESQASETVINLTFYDENNIPVGGHSVAKYRGGQWILTP